MDAIITTFEIYATDLERAAKFYSGILGRDVPVRTVGGEMGGLLSSPNAPLLGIIRCAPDYAKPSEQGTNVYFRIEKDLDGILKNVESLGGKVVVPKMDAGDFGQFAWIIDSEGNRVGLNLPKA